MINSIAANHVYIACGYTDLRRSIDGLISIVVHSFKLDPMSSSLFLFCGRRSDRIKALFWDGDGFILLYKRLERGKYQWPRRASGVAELSRQQLRWLMEGLAIVQPKANQRVGKITLA